MCLAPSACWVLSTEIFLNYVNHSCNFANIIILAVNSSLIFLTDLGMIWVGDMLLSHESNEMMLDSQSGSPLFTDSPHPLEDMRGRVPLVSGNVILLTYV